MTHSTVAVLGGGLAGLNAARLLHRAGIDFRLYEARDRFGGRILTVDAMGREAGDGFDPGPSGSGRRCSRRSPHLWTTGAGQLCPAQHRRRDL